MKPARPNAEVPLMAYLRVVRARGWIIATFTVVLLIVVLAATAVSTRYYGAAATVEMAPRAPMILEGVAQVVPPAFQDRYQFKKTQQWILTSPEILNEAARRLTEVEGVDDFDGVDEPSSLLALMLEIDPVPDTFLVKVKVRHTEPEKAALFANVVAQTYIDKNLERSLETGKQALDYLKTQQEVYRKRNEDTRRAVVAYAAEHNLSAPDQQTVTVETLKKLQEELAEVHAERVRSEANKDGLVKMARRGDYVALADLLSSTQPTIQDTLSRYRATQEERAGLLAKHKSKHPVVIQADAEIAGFKLQLREMVNDHIDGQRADVELLVQQETNLELEVQTSNAAMVAQRQDTVGLTIRSDEAERTSAFHADLDIRATEVTLQQFIQANNIRLVNRARPSDTPVSPIPLYNVIASIIIGLLGGTLVTFVVEYLDSTVKTREAIEAAVGAPLLGIVPLVNTAELANLSLEVDRSVFAHAMPRSPVAECLRTIRTNLMFRAQNRTLGRLLIASANPREGKSFLSANLAAIIAMAGARVLILDADLRRPAIHKRYAIPNEPGLVDVLVGDTPVHEAIRPSHVPGVDIIPAGQTPENPSELLSPAAMTELMDSLPEYDVILIDSPPVNVVADALVLASLVDGIILVVESGRSSNALLQSCAARLRSVNQLLLGAIVNKLNVQRNGYEYNYDYHHYYEYYNVRPTRGPRAASSSE